LVCGKNGVQFGQRFAFDAIKSNDSLSNFYEGDPEKNASYFAYNASLFAVADGQVIEVQDGKAEHFGNKTNKAIPMDTTDDACGNFIIIKIGEKCYATYAHCQPKSINVKKGDFVKEGDRIATLGNSGNSTMPHLHFHLSDGPDVVYSNGLPYVFKAYKKIGEVILEKGEMTGGQKVSPVQAAQANMEWIDIVNFK